jgi:dynein heavy chain, axonemal
MTVGPVGCGKTTINNILTEALTAIGQAHKITRMNPKSITGQEMYGVMNNVTGEWIPGVYSQIWKKCNDRKNKYTSWIQCDGPVDAIWVENLNTVLDDNKILTLANAERIPMTDNCKMTFEVGNLDNASPATVSRCGIVYVSETDLNWEPQIECWIRDRVEEKKYCHPDEGTWINECIKKYIEKKDMFVTLVKEYVYVMYTPPVVRIYQFLNLLTAVFLQFLEKAEQLDKKTFEMYFIYCFAWSIGGLFETEEREKFQRYLESCGGPLPPIQANKISIEKETVFDFYVDPASKSWKLWEAGAWPVPKKLAFSQLLIPTMDSTRTEFIIDKIAKLPQTRSEKRKEPGNLSTLLTGAAGTAKTSVILMYTSNFDKDYMLMKRINFSSATTPYNFQESIENEVERKQGRTFVPPGGKKMTVFLDDMSMPFVNAWGDQITLEIVRQLIDHKGFYFLTKDDRGYFRNIEGLQYLGAMNHPGGGRNDIPHRLKRQFFLINMTLPSTRSIENIYGKILE